MTTAKMTKTRWVVAGLMWFAIAINYIDRTVLSAAAPQMSKEFGLTADMMGIVLSAFFWSYALLQIPAGSQIVLGKKLVLARRSAPGRLQPRRRDWRPASSRSSVSALRWA